MYRADLRAVAPRGAPPRPQTQLRAAPQRTLLLTGGATLRVEEGGVAACTAEEEGAVSLEADRLTAVIKLSICYEVVE